MAVPWWRTGGAGESFVPYLTAASRARSPVYNQLPRLHFMFVIVLTKKKLPFLVASLSFLSRPSGMWRMQEAHVVLVATWHLFCLSRPRVPTGKASVASCSILARQMFLDHHSFCRGSHSSSPARYNPTSTGRKHRLSAVLTPKTRQAKLPSREPRQTPSLVFYLFSSFWLSSVSRSKKTWNIKIKCCSALHWPGPFYVWFKIQHSVLCMAGKI